MQLAGFQGAGLRIGANARVDEPAMKAHRLIGCFQRDGKFRDAGRAEIARNASDRDY